MNLEDLRVFRVVAKEGNFTKAAQHLNFVQSNITAKIKRLEQKYETTLFYRHKHGVTLTSTGQTFLSYAEEILHLMDEAENALKNTDIQTGTLSIGSMETTAATLLPDILSTYHDRFPRVELSLKTGSTQGLMKAVMAREIEGAFVAGEINHPDLEETEVFEDELVLVSKENVLSSADFEQLKNQTIIVFQSGCFYREIFERWLKSEGILPVNMMELNTLDGVIGCVKAGLGVSLLTKTAANELPQCRNIKQLALPKEYSAVSIKFVNHRNIVKTPAFQAFISVLGAKVV